MRSRASRTSRKRMRAEQIQGLDANRRLLYRARLPARSARTRRLAELEQTYWFTVQPRLGFTSPACSLARSRTVGIIFCLRRSCTCCAPQLLRRVSGATATMSGEFQLSDGRSDHCSLERPSGASRSYLVRCLPERSLMFHTTANDARRCLLCMLTLPCSGSVDSTRCAILRLVVRSRRRATLINHYQTVDLKEADGGNARQPDFESDWQRYTEKFGL
jgi:hypothetical protein